MQGAPRATLFKSRSISRRHQSKTTVVKKNRTTKHKVNNNRPINQELIDTVCPECGFVLTTKIYKKAIEVSYTDYVTEYDCTACIQCMEGEQQYNNQLERNNNLRNMYNKQQELPTSNATSQTVHVDLETFLTEQLGTQYASHIMSLYENTKLKVNVLDINEDALTKREYYRKVGPINGAHWLVDDDYSNPHPNTLSHERSSANFTVVKLRKHDKGQDFLAISKHNTIRWMSTCFAHVR